MNEKPLTLEDRKRLTFRQAEGTEAAPAALKWGELDEDLRLEIWSVIHDFLELHRPGGGSFFRRTFIRSLAEALRRPLKLPIDEALRLFESFAETAEILKQIVLKSDYDDVIEIVQSLVRWFSDDAFLPRGIAVVFSDPRSPYQLITPPPTVAPKGVEIEGHSVATDLAEIKASAAKGAYAALGSCGRRIESQ